MNLSLLNIYLIVFGLAFLFTSITMYDEDEEYTVGHWFFAMIGGAVPGLNGIILLILFFKFWDKFPDVIRKFRVYRAIAGLMERACDWMFTLVIFKREKKR